MATPWDDSLKVLINENAQDFATWLFCAGYSLTGRRYSRFTFSTLNCYKLTPDQLRHLGLPGLLPLMLLTQGGTTRQIAEEIITDLEQASKNDAVSAFSLLASLVSTSPVDLEWLRKRVHTMYETWQDNWLVQELTKGAVEKEREEARKVLEEEYKAHEVEHKALEQERQQRLQGLRDLLLAFVERRFSDAKLLRIAKRQVAIIDDPRILQSLLLKVDLAQTTEKAKDYLVDWPDTDEEQS